MTADRYNYPNFSFAMEEPELDAWRRSGPRIGSAAPDFELADPDGAAVRLSTLRGRPVVLEFGSYTCPIFSDRVPDMERLAPQHPEAVFVVVVVREAHPGEVTGPHRSAAQKRTAARRLVLEEGIRRRVLVDDVDGTVHRSYGGAWNPVYLIDADGRIAYRRAWNHPGELAAAIDALALGAPITDTESTEMAGLPGRAPVGARLLERGGAMALLDFYRTAPSPVQDRLRHSPSTAVRTTIQQEES